MEVLWKALWVLSAFGDVEKGVGFRVMDELGPWAEQFFMMLVCIISFNGLENLGDN